MKRNPLTVNDALGAKYTDVYLWSQWGTDCYLLHFDTPLTEGVYEIVVPEGRFRMTEFSTGDILVENNATPLPILRSATRRSPPRPVSAWPISACPNR